MSQRLDWEKARQRDHMRRRPKGVRTTDSKDTRRIALGQFATQHDLSCFKCGSRTNEWAKTGISLKGPWAICVPCIEKRTSG